MGYDSITFEQSLFIKYMIFSLFSDICACSVYGNSGTKCIRCEDMSTANRLFPVQYAQAAANYEKHNGVQPR